MLDWRQMYNTRNTLDYKNELSLIETLPENEKETPTFASWESKFLTNKLTLKQLRLPFQEIQELSNFMIIF